MRDAEFMQALLDAGCTETQAVDIQRLREQGRTEEVLRSLRCCRCEQLGAVHEEQRKIDLYDYLIKIVRDDR